LKNNFLNFELQKFKALDGGKKDTTAFSAASKVRKLFLDFA
jgi:hypothetical protein